MPKKTIQRKRKNSPDKFYLGVDGGGTKTHVILLDREKNFVSEGFAGPSNPLRVGIETAVANIAQAVDTACDRAQKTTSEIVSAVLGLAGVRRLDIRERIRERSIEIFGIEIVKVVTDAEIALFATTLGGEGVVIISGTGSVCFGRDALGNTAMSGGWGPTAGDEGGGISIARHALQAIAKASDGRGASTRLSLVGAEYFRASTPEDLVVAIYSPQMDNSKLAGFAQFVAQTAHEGDEIAIEILAVAGHELGLAANAVIQKLNLQNGKVPIGTVGSVFKAGDLLTNSLLETVRRIAPQAFLQEPAKSPAEAAALAAFDHFNEKNF